jgi:hypothetical protein
MADTYFVSTVWTSGDILTEAKLDNMTANDRAVDAMAQGIEFVERATPSTPGANKVHLYAKDKAGVPTLYAIDDSGTDYEFFTTDNTHAHDAADTGGVLYNYRAFSWGILGTLSTGNNQGMRYLAPQDLTCVRLHYQTTSGTATIRITEPGETLISGVSVTSTAQSTTGFAETDIEQGDLVELDITAASGTDLWVTLECRHTIMDS